MPDLKAAADFIAALTGTPDSPVSFQTFDDRSTKRPELARVLNGTLTEHAAKLEALNAKGAGVFITVNQTDLHGRREENIVALRALFVDSDHGELPPCIPMPDPSIVVRSAHGPHIYWLLEQGAPLDAFTDAQRRLASALGTDPKIKDLPRVMRLPGFDHNKAAPTPVITEECHPERRFAFWELLRGLPVTQTPAKPAAPDWKPPRAPGGGVLRRAVVWMAKRDNVAKGDRNNVAFTTACNLVEFGLTDNEAYELLEDWNKGNSPPLEDAELKAVWGSASKHATPGSKPERPTVVHHHEGPIPPEPPDAPPPATATRGEIGPNDLAMLLMRDEHIVCDTNDNLYHYTGTYWRAITSGGLRAMLLPYEEIEDTNTKRRTEAMNYVMDATRRKTLIEWNKISPSEVPFRNGMLDFITGSIETHRPEDFLDRVMPHDYTPGARSPLWQQLLGDWFGDDPDYRQKVDALQEFFGYVLMQHARYKKALVLYGESDTGKSQVAQVLRLMVGDHNVCQIGIDRMNDPKQLAPIQGKMLNLVTELPEDSLVADGGFKQLVSTQEPVQIDEKYKAQITYVPTAKHVFATNNLPDINDKTRATYNRLLVVRFNYVIPRDKQDKDLMDKLAAELAGITNWALEGAQRLTVNSGEFTRIPESESLIEEYRLEQNPMQMFVDDRLERHPASRIEFKRFCDIFNLWNPGGRKWSSRAIGKALTAVGLRRMQIHGTRFVVGATLKEELVQN